MMIMENMTNMNAQITLDLNKVIYMGLFYENQEGMIKQFKPLVVTVHGKPIPLYAYASYHHDYPEETIMERARRLDTIDVWTVCLIVHMQGGVRFRFTSDRAKTLWKSWNAKIYNKKKT